MIDAPIELRARHVLKLAQNNPAGGAEQ